MNLEIKSHYWPKTPQLREIRLYINGNLIESSFMSIYQLQDLIETLKISQTRLLQIIDDIYSG